MNDYEVRVENLEIKGEEEQRSYRALLRELKPSKKKVEHLECEMSYLDG